MSQSHCHDHQGCCGHHHHHAHQECCGHHHHDECSDEHHHHNHEGDFADELLALADEAWTEVLKERIKAEIIKNNDAKLSELAKIISDSNNNRWRNKLSTQQQSCSYKEQIHEFFHHHHQGSN